MNPKYNTICIQIVNYLSKHFSSTNGVPSQILKTPDLLKSFWCVIMCYALRIKTLPRPRKENPDPTRMIQQPFKTIQRPSWEIWMGLLCCVMCSYAH